MNDDDTARGELVAWAVDAMARDIGWSGAGAPGITAELADTPAPLLRAYLLTALHRLRVERLLRQGVEHELQLRELGETPTDDLALYFIADNLHDLSGLAAETHTPGSLVRLEQRARP